MNGTSDQALLEQFLDGDMSAYEQLVARYEKPVFNFIRRMIGHPQEAEDLTQEAFIRVYEQADRLTEKRAFRSWLWSVAANLCRDHLKRQAYRRHLSVDHDVNLDRDVASPSSPDRDLEEAEVEQIIDQAIATLRSDRRMVIVLREYQGLSYEEIAETVGCSVSTVKSRLHMARQELRKRLAFLLDS